MRQVPAVFGAVFSVVLGLGAATGLVGCETTDRDIEMIPLAEVRELVAKREKHPHAVILIDPRNRRAFETEHLPGAVHVQTPDIDETRDRDSRIEKFDEIVVYGDDPGTVTGKSMAKILMRSGYRHVRLFLGGLREWKQAGYPTESGAGTTLDEVSRAK